MRVRHAVLILVLLAVSAPVQAHPAPFSYLDLHLRQGQVEGSLVVHTIDVAATLWQRDLKYEGTPLPDGFRYASDTNPQWLTIEQIRQFVAPFDESNLQEV